MENGLRNPSEAGPLHSNRALSNGGPARWALGLGVTRAALGLLCLGAQLLAVPAANRIATALILVFALYGLAILFWRRITKAGAALLSLILDTIFFLVFVEYGAGNGGWLSSAFYVYLLLSAVMVHQWRDICIVAGTSAGFLTMRRSPSTNALWWLVLWGGLLASIIGYEKRKIERRVGDRTREAEHLRAKAEHAQIEERQRIAGDFHDGPLQSFISFQLRLEALRKILARDLQAGLEEVAQLQDLSKSQVRELRAFLRGMRPVEMEGDSLAASLRRVVSDFQKESEIMVTLQGGEGIQMERAEASVEVLQIVREALHNVRKHSKATRVAVTAHQSGESLEISIEDNGCGFAFSGSYTLEELERLDLGPRSIKRRVRHLGGQLLVDSRPERGAAVKVLIPA